MFYIVGLGNPGAEYEKTRHNTGRLIVASFVKTQHLPSLVPSKKYASLISEGDIDGKSTLVLLPETYMNKSGTAVAKAVTNKARAQRLMVVYDDLDLPLGSIKLSYGRGSGGHRGVESVIKALKTKDFLRIRVGIMPTTPSGRPKKPKGEKAVLDFLLSDFKKPERVVVDKMAQRAGEAVVAFVTEGRAHAMNEFN